VKKNLYIIIPVFNEERNIYELIGSLSIVKETASPKYEVIAIFVDDGSVDNTYKYIKKCNNNFEIVVLRHQKNLGPGAAFGTGFEYLSNRLSQDDLVVTMEGDNTSSIDTLKHMLIRKKEGYDVVLASPYLYGGSFSEVSKNRLILSHIANGLVKIFLGIRGIQTFSSFFRLYSGRILQRLQSEYGNRIIETKGFECMIEMTGKLIKIGATISEVEFNLNWEKRKGKSKMKTSKTIFGYLRLFAMRNRLLKTTIEKRYKKQLRVLTQLNKD
jgi:dolichol-phosphate mannosyltransferase